MKHLYIIGARGCGRETYGLFQSCKETLGEIECRGFLDDKMDALDGYMGYPPIISSAENYIPKNDDVFICALGEPKWVKHYTEIIENKGGKFISLISPKAFIGQNTIIGDGCIINSLSTISPDVKIGKHVYCGAYTNIGHDVTIYDCSHLGAFTFLGGGVHIGKCVTLHPRANILPHKKVGENSVVGAASVVLRNVMPDTTVFGIPAKKI